MTKDDRVAIHRERYPRTEPVPGKPLGRIIHHDERSRLYPFRAPIPGKRTSVRHARVPLGTVLDQANLGSCTGNACLGAIFTQPLQGALALTPVKLNFDETTAIKLYSAATVLDEFAGTYPPDDTGSSGLAVAKAAQQAGYISGYLHAFSADDALDALVAGPIIVGVDWHSGFDNPSADGEMRLAGPVRGGHELCVDQIDVENQRVWVTNSWSKSWGLDGRAWWSWSTFAALLAKDGDATILVPLTQPAPTPAPPTPAPDPGAASFLDEMARYPLAMGRITGLARRKKMTVDAYAAWRLAGDLKGR